MSTMTFRRALSCTAVALAALCPLPVSPTWAADPVTVMLVGDSVTQGSSGDWTWRYWLWKHLQTSTQVDFVGPRDDLFDEVGHSSGSHEYADPDFDQDHAATWGASLVSKTPEIHQLVETHHPDVVVEMLGVNDLTWLGRTPVSVSASVEQFVGEVRAADPDTDVVIGAVPQGWVPGAAEFNGGLAVLAQSLNEPASQVVSACGPLDEVTDTYDSCHPNTTGEVRIAACLADSLATLDVGTPYPRPLPVVANGPRRPAVLTGWPGDGQVALSWVPPPGATAEYIWLRDSTLAETWRRLPLPVQGTSISLNSLIDYHAYEFRVQSAKGTAVAQDLFSNTVSAVPSPPAVSGLVASPGDHRARVTWESAEVSGYRVTWWRIGDRAHRRTRLVSSTSARLRMAPAGTDHRVTVAAVSGQFLGPQSRIDVTPGGPDVRGPRHLRAVARSDGRYSLSWSPAADATRFEIWRCGPNGVWQRLARAHRRQFVTGRFRRPGVQFFRVRSWHDSVAGGWSAVSVGTPSAS